MLSWINCHIRIRTSGVLHEDPSWRWLSGGADDNSFVFWIIAGGAGKLQAGADSVDLRRGICVHSPMREAHDGVQRPDSLLHIPWFVFEYVDPASGESVLPRDIIARTRIVPDTLLMQQLVERAVDAHRAAGPPHNPQSSGWAFAALLEAHRADQLPSPETDPSGRHAAVIELAQKIRRAPGAPYTLESLAESVHCTPDHLIRLFKTFLGVTPVEHVIRCRVELAQQLLLFSGLPVRLIAERAGYADAAYFCRQFSSRAGVSPTQFRKHGRHS